MGIFRDSSWVTWEDADGVTWGGRMAGQNPNSPNPITVQIPHGENGTALVTLERRPVKVYDPRHAPEKGYWMPFKYPKVWRSIDDKTGKVVETPVDIKSLALIDLLAAIIVLTLFAIIVVGIAA